MTPKACRGSQSSSKAVSFSYLRLSSAMPGACMIACPPEHILFTSSQGTEVPSCAVLVDFVHIICRLLQTSYMHAKHVLTMLHGKANVMLLHGMLLAVV